MADLTFTTADSLWAPDRSGTYEAQCAAGRRYAEELVSHMQSDGNLVIFGSVIRAIVEGGKYEGPEIGFCAGVGIELLGMIE